MQGMNTRDAFALLAITESPTGALPVGKDAIHRSSAMELERLGVADIVETDAGTVIVRANPPLFGKTYTARDGSKYRQTTIKVDGKRKTLRVPMAVVNRWTKARKGWEKKWQDAANKLKDARAQKLEKARKAAQEKREKARARKKQAADKKRAQLRQKRDGGREKARARASAGPKKRSSRPQKKAPTKIISGKEVFCFVEIDGDFYLATASGRRKTFATAAAARKAADKVGGKASGRSRPFYVVMHDVSEARDVTPKKAEPKKAETKKAPPKKAKAKKAPAKKAEPKKAPPKKAPPKSVAVDSDVADTAAQARPDWLPDPDDDTEFVADGDRMKARQARAMALRLDAAWQDLKQYTAAYQKVQRIAEGLREYGEKVESKGRKRYLRINDHEKIGVLLTAANNLLDEQHRLRAKEEEKRAFRPPPRGTEASRHHELFKLLQQVIPDLHRLHSGFYYKAQSEPYMPLSVETQDISGEMRKAFRLTDVPSDKAMRIIIEHNYTQEGDLMSDPRMDFLLVQPTQSLIPLDFTQSAPPVYDVAYRVEGGKLQENKAKARSLVTFALQWFRNLVQQGFDVPYGRGATAEALDLDEEASEGQSIRDISMREAADEMRGFFKVLAKRGEIGFEMPSVTASQASGLDMINIEFRRWDGPGELYDISRFDQGDAPLSDAASERLTQTADLAEKLRIESAHPKYAVRVTYSPELTKSSLEAQLAEAQQEQADEEPEVEAELIEGVETAEPTAPRPVGSPLPAGVEAAPVAASPAKQEISDADLLASLTQALSSPQMIEAMRQAGESVKE